MKNCFLNNYRNCLLFWAFIFCMFLSLFGKAYASEIKDRIIVISGIQNDQIHLAVKNVLTEAYKRIGYSTEFELYPGERSLQSADQGMTDGAIARTKEVGKVFSNLIEVPTPIAHFKGVVFTKSITRKINSWKDLKGLRIGVIRGMRYATSATKGFNPFFAEDITHLFKLLSQDRIQVAVAALSVGKIEINKNFKNKGIHVSGRPLISAPLYHFVHIKNKLLINDLNQALKDMAGTGEIEKIHKITMGKYFEPREKIIWPYICYKPLYICKNEKLVDGAGYHILKLIWEKMPEYDHEFMLTPVKRVVESLKIGQRQLFYGLYKTPQREEFLHYSLPCRISTPTFIITRKNKLNKLKKEGRISLKYLLEKTDLKFLMLNSISYGAGLDKILMQHKKNPNVTIEYDTTDMGRKSLKLLLGNRVDYIFSLNGSYSEALELGVSEQLDFFRIKETSDYKVGYITAPKTDWGKQKIKQVNEILKEEIPLESFFQFFTPLVNKGMLPELRKQFNKKILEPVKTAG